MPLTMFPFLRKKAEGKSGERTKKHVEGKRSLDFDERGFTPTRDELIGTYIPRCNSDTELQRTKDREVLLSPLGSKSGAQADTEFKTPTSKVPISQSPELGRLFQNDTEEHSFEPNSPIRDDPILGVHVEQVHTSLPRIVHPNQRPTIMTANTNVAEIVLSSNTLATPPECPRAPPPSPYNTTFGHKVHESMDDFSDEEDADQNSDEFSSGGQYDPYRDYLGVDIPDSELSAPAEIYQMIWGKFT